MFWNNESGIQVDNITARIQCDDLDGVLNDPYCYQEVKDGNAVLLDYLTRPSILLRLLNDSVFYKPDLDMDVEEQYSKAPLSIGILSMGSPVINEAIVANPEILNKLVNYYKPNEASYLNTVTAGFYKRLMLALLLDNSGVDSILLDALESANFLDDVVANLHLGASVELLGGIPTQSRNLQFQQRILEWYTRVKLFKKIVDRLTPNAEAVVLENVLLAFNEFEEMIPNLCDLANDYMLAFYNEETVATLLDTAFPSNADQLHPDVADVAVQLLISVLEMNHESNEPSYKVYPDYYLRPPADEFYDVDFQMGALVANRSTDIVRTFFTAVNHPDEDRFLGTAVWCMELLQAIVNNSNVSYHEAVKAALSDSHTSWRDLLLELKHRPSFAILNSHIISFFAFILWGSATDSFPLLDMLFRSQPTILELVIHNSHSPSNDHSDNSLVTNCFLQMAQHINFCQDVGSHASLYINMLIEESSSNEQWADLTNTSLKSYSEHNKTQYVSTVASDRSLVVDELEKSMELVIVNDGSEDSLEHSKGGLNRMDGVLETALKSEGASEASEPSTAPSVEVAGVSSPQNGPKQEQRESEAAQSVQMVPEERSSPHEGTGDRLVDVGQKTSPSQSQAADPCLEENFSPISSDGRSEGDNLDSTADFLKFIQGTTNSEAQGSLDTSGGDNELNLTGDCEWPETPKRTTTTDPAKFANDWPVPDWPSPGPANQSQNSGWAKF